MASTGIRQTVRLFRGEDAVAAAPPRDRIGRITKLGAATETVLGRVHALVSFAGELAASLRRPRATNLRSLPALIARAGADGIPIVLVLNFLVGFVMAFQSTQQLKMYGANIYVADIVGISVTRELAPLMTAIIMAGRSGAAFAGALIASATRAMDSVGDAGRTTVCALAGCALTSKAKPVEIRFFTPAVAVVAPTEKLAEPARARLGRVTASRHLRSRIAHRHSAVEVILADTQRWTEAPESYVRRSLMRALFDERGVTHVVGGGAPTLNVEVIAFEHVERAGRHLGYVQLRDELDDERTVVAAGTVSVEREAGGADIEVVVGAIGAALEAASAEVADRVVRGLHAPPSGAGHPRCSPDP